MKYEVKENGCWQFIGSLVKGGYGRIQVNGKRMLAHRYMYEQKFGKISKGLTVDHLCRNPSCLNPDHFELVTLAENVLRGNGPCAINARKTHCKRGHKLGGHNLLIRSGKRQCRICTNKAQLKRYHDR